MVVQVGDVFTATQYCLNYDGSNKPFKITIRKVHKEYDWDWDICYLDSGETVPRFSQYMRHWWDTYGSKKVFFTRSRETPPTEADYEEMV